VSRRGGADAGLEKGSMPARRAIAGFAAAAAVAVAVGSAGAAERLGALPIDPAQVSVAGISSGAFMANQIHVADSAGVMGAAIIAGGLYACAVQDVTSEGVLPLASQAAGPGEGGGSLRAALLFLARPEGGHPFTPSSRLRCGS